eukprot:scaffold1610_cov39-Cyclotella_meneghiniana.AAC.1
MPNTPRFHRRKASSSSPSPSTTNTASSSSWFANLRNNVRLTPTRSKTPIKSNNASQYNSNNNNDNYNDDNYGGLNNKSRGRHHSSSNGNAVANNYQLDDSLHRRSECTSSASAVTQLHNQHMNQTNHNHHAYNNNKSLQNPPDLLDDSNDEMGFLSSSPSWTDPEQLFSSPDDISVDDSNIDNHHNNNGDDGEDSSQEPSIFSTDFLPPLFDNYLSPNNNHHNLNGNGGDDETCNNTITEIKKQRSKKAIRASTVGAFNTFLKALFGIGMLSNPAVLGEVGLVLGTFCHLFIIVGCAFACYLLLTARKLAVGEVREREWREEVEAEEYNEYLRVREEKLVRRNKRGGGVLNKERQYKSMMDLHQFGNENDGDVNGSLNRNDDGDWNNGDFDYTNGYGTPIRPPLGMSIHSYNNNNNNNNTTSAAAAASTMQTPDGWGRCQNSMAQATNDVLSPSEGVGPSCEPCAIGAGTTAYNVMSGETESSNNEDNDGIRLVPPPPLIDDDADDNNNNNTMTNNGVNNSKNRTIIEPARQHNPLFEDPPNLHRKSCGFKRNTSSQPLTSNYHRFEDTQGSSFNNNMMRHSNSQTSLAKLTNAALMAPPKKSKKVRLVTYGDVAKYLAGPTFAQLIIFTIVAVHLMFASGMLHIAIENLCYIAGWDRLGFSYADVMYTGDDDYY